MFRGVSPLLDRLNFSAATGAMTAKPMTLTMIAAAVLLMILRRYFPEGVSQDCNKIFPERYFRALSG
jgi:hypothetical protein